MSLLPHRPAHEHVTEHHSAPARSPSFAPEVKRDTTQQLALDHGSDPTGAKFNLSAGCPGGSPGRPLDTPPTAQGEPNAAMGAAAPSPQGAQDHKPGEFEQPPRWDGPQAA